VKKILTEIITADGRVLKDKDVVVRLNEMAASTLNFIVYAWTSNGDAQNVKWDLLEAFKRALDKNNINIAYPQMDVHLYPAAPVVVDKNAQTAQ